jgi:O-antigen ligase
MVPVVPFVLNGLVMSGSRGGFLALLAGGLAFWILRPRGETKRLVPYVSLGMVLLLYVASDFFWQRMATLEQVTQAEQAEEIDGSIATRLALFGAQWEMAKDYPLGAGHRGTTALSYTYLEDRHMSRQGGRASHNTIMSALVDQGFPGLLLWVAILVMLSLRILSSRRLAREANEPALGWLIAGVGAMFATIVTAGMFSPQLRSETYIWTLALVCILHRLAQEAAHASSSEAVPVARPEETTTERPPIDRRGTPLYPALESLRRPATRASHPPSS